MFLPTPQVVQNNSLFIRYFFGIAKTVSLGVLRDHVAHPSQLTVVNDQVNLGGEVFREVKR